MPSTQRSPRRADALSKEKITETAIDILDSGGESALTFRTLAARLATGSGAIYHHVANKNDLLAAATGDIITRSVTGVSGGAQPREAIRLAALGLYDAIHAHPWVGAQLSREPWQPAMLSVFEAFGRQLQALGVRQPALFDAASALLNYVSGLAGQYAAGARLLPRETDRQTFLAGISAQWMQLDPAQYQFVRQMASHLAEHDDRQQFLAGIDLILAGIKNAR